ncbi:hypothetical protein EHE19_016310 [Ruminiclostridium herbifermentans]|uniref:Uncharacterized protein n=1 Tax=Ruminiclostridium herbifermentans TaxID=2488810 RepID=A0A4U7J5P7_9FIRM|nr:hypothetical protein [Ruminiclostridium herbifermentans]QNU66410.1 hypothetical protein EHE19_016310 [Ruminiclostridium herbifermentans]
MYLKKLIMLKQLNESIFMDKRNASLQIALILLLSAILPIISNNSLGELPVNLVILRVSMYSMVLTIFSFALKTFFIERVQGTLVPLLSTPIKMTDIIFGKSFFLVITATLLSLVDQAIAIAYIYIINQSVTDIKWLLLQVIIQTLFVIPFFTGILSNIIGVMTMTAKNNRTASLSSLLPSLAVFILFAFTTNKEIHILYLQVIIVVSCIILNIAVFFYLKYRFNSERVLYERFSK